MVLYGDSHAGMWFPDIEKIASRAHWRLIVLLGHSCALSWFPEPLPGPFGDGAYCNRLHRFAVQTIKRINPDLLIVAQAVEKPVTPLQWRRGLAQQLRRMAAPNRVELVIGQEPYVGGPVCLAQHVKDVQVCSLAPINAYTPYVDAERQAAAAVGARYIDVTPWFCARRCDSVIGKYDVYFNSEHVAIGYAHFLEGVLAQAIDLPDVSHLTVLH